MSSLSTELRKDNNILGRAFLDDDGRFAELRRDGHPARRYWVRVGTSRVVERARSFKTLEEAFYFFMAVDRPPVEPLGCARSLSVLVCA
jgi:hypothetical protein